MKLLLVLATAITLAAAGSRSYRTESHHSRHSNREAERDRDRRSNLDYEDIETADQDHVERFEEPSERSEPVRKSNRIGVYATAHSIQVAKNKAQQRRLAKLSAVKDSEASGTHFEGTHYGGHYGAPQVQQIHTHEILTNQGLVQLYNPQGVAAHGHPGGNIVLTGGIGVTGLGDAHHGAHGPILLHGGGPGGPGLIAANPAAVGPAAVGPPPENDLGADITKSVYVFSAPPDPYDFLPRQTISKVPRGPQKHYQVLFINAPSPPPPQQHHVEIPPPPELKTLVYVLVKKPQPPPPINFIKTQPSLHHKPEVYFIRYKNRGFGLSPAPVDETIPVGHPGVQYAPLSPQEEIRGNIDYGPAHPSQYEPAGHHPYELNGYQDDAHLAATQVLTQRGSNREVDAGVTGI